MSKREQEVGFPIPLSRVFLFSYLSKLHHFQFWTHTNTKGLGSKDGELEAEGKHLL